MRDGPFTDDMVRHMVKTAQTHEAISEYGEAMANFLAEAAMASSKAVGDRPETAVRKWMQVIQERAMQLISEKRSTANQKAIAAPDVIEGSCD